MAGSVIWGQATPRLAPLAGEHNVDVVIVGLGGGGLTAAVEAAKRGLKVIGIDAAAIGGGAAGRNGGFLMAGLSIAYDEAITYLGHDRAEAWYAATEDELRRTEHHFPAIVNNTGSLRLATEPNELEAVAREFEARAADGFSVSWYSGIEGQGFIAHSDGALNPLSRCQRLAQEAERLGVLLAEKTPAISIADNTVQIPNGEIHARVVIVAVDGNLETVLPQLATRVRSTRLQMVSTAPLPVGLIRYPTYARWGFDYYLQLPTGEVALGGRRDKHYDEEWGAPAEAADPIQFELDELIAKITFGRGVVKRRWAGVVSYTHDHLPVCERVGTHVYVMGAYSGLGNVTSTLCGRAIVAELFGEGRLYDILRSDTRTVTTTATARAS